MCVIVVIKEMCSRILLGFGVDELVYYSVVCFIYYDIYILLIILVIF